MKLTELVGFMFELTDNEKAKLEAIAQRDGTTPEKALKKAMENFLDRGVQTPNTKRRKRAA